MFIAQLYRVSFFLASFIFSTPFLLQAADKFFDGQLGTVIEYNSSISEIRAPSVSVCPIEKKWLLGAQVKSKF